MRVLGLIPARGGSTAIPRKNLVELGGEPLLAWTARPALASQLTQVVLSTDDDEIAAVGRRLGLEVPFMRPSHLATASARSIDTVIHALDVLDASFDAVMLLQPTSPFRSIEDINGSIDLLERSDGDSVISVCDVGGHHPARMKTIEDGVLLDPPFTEDEEGQPRQELQQFFIRNGAIYLTRSDVIRDRSLKGSRSLAWVMPEARSINIDEPHDLLVARSYLEAKWQS